MTDNLELWNKLGKTAPEHTKKFARAGGFRGTAIKPIYTEQKMTEVFGPAGKGWGMGEPTFQVVTGNDSQVAVYCTVALWWRTNETSTEINKVYGVGGDMVVVKQSSGMRTDDEAFKKAFTDAVGNAMKHLGMSADVHMGLFDDSKYVREREAEERGAETTTDAPTDASEPIDDTIARTLFPTIQTALMACTTTKQLEGAWSRYLPVMSGWSEFMQENCDGVYQEMRKHLAEHDGDARKASRDTLEGILRAAVSMDDLKAKWQEMEPALKKIGKDDVSYLGAVKDAMKATIQKMGKMPDFDNLEPTHEQKIAGTI